MTQEAQTYNLVAIRDLLLAAFTAETLPRFCQDRPLFRPIVDTFSPHHGLDDMVAETIDYCETSLLFAELLAEVRHSNPRQHGRFGPYLCDPQRIFLCYKRYTDPDDRLAKELYEFLSAQGHEVFIDATMRTGEAWLDEIDRQIRRSDFLIVLLSKESADSEMVRAEVRRAYAYRKKQGHPKTLPVRVDYDGILPYSIDAFVDSLQYLAWRDQTDTLQWAQDILAAIEGRPLQAPPEEPGARTDQITVTDDGRMVTDHQALYPPLHEFDPRFLEELEAPGGAVKLSDRLYIRRQADDRLEREIVKSGTTTTIRAARQTGKSSLLVRGMYHAQQNGAKVVNLDMQRVDGQHLQTLDGFLYYIASSIVRKLRLDQEELRKFWQSTPVPQDRLTYFLEDYLLLEVQDLVVVALDEADRLLLTDFYQDLFSLVRSWHNCRAYDEQWNKLNIVLVISTEPYLLIRDIEQSPFNVGLKLYLEDFGESQVQDLNERHGSPVRSNELPQLMELLDGHPYLTRKALYTLVVREWQWAELVRRAPSDQGPFADHLRNHYWRLLNEPDLGQAMREVIRHGRCSDEMSFYRLLRAGLVKGRGDVCRCRCDLYRVYLQDKL